MILRVPQTSPTSSRFILAEKAIRYLSFLVFSFWILIGSAPALRAQSPNVQHTENRADQSLRGNFRVDPATLGMSFSIPLGGYPGRAGNHVPVTLNYNSKLWRIDYDGTYPWLNQNRTWTRAKYAETSTSGWTSSLEIPFIEYTGRTQFYDAAGNSICGLCPEETAYPYYIKRIHVHLADGSTQELQTDEGAIPFDPQYPGGNFTGVFKAIDGSGMYFDSSTNTLYLPDGSRYFFSSTEVSIHGKMGLPATAYIDRHGNTLPFNFQNRSWSDTLGRILYDPIPNQPPAPGPQTYNLPGMYGNTNLPYILRWANLGTVLRVVQPLRYTGDRKCSATITNLSPALFQTFDSVSFLCANLSGGNPELFNPVVLSEVELPNGQKYRFKYNIYGEIEQIFLPTGGYERYQYAEILALSLPNQPYAQSNRGVTSRWISVDGTTELSHWQYSLVSSIPYILRTTAPDGSYTERVIIQGSSPLGQFPFGMEPVTAGMIKEERAYTSTLQMWRRSLTEWLIPGRPTKEISIILDTGGNALATTTTHQYDADRNNISSSKYDFAAVNQSTAQTGDISSIPSGPLVRTGETTFLVNDPLIDAGTKAAYRARNLISLPTSSRVKNAAGTIVAKNEFKYDEGAYPLLTYGPVSGWNNPNTSVRGLVTTARNWLNTTGSWLETHAQFDQCGNPRKTWDARGYVSEMEYHSAYHRAYMTQSTSPDPDGGGPLTPLVNSAVFDLTSGVPLSKTDANIRTTTFEYSSLDALSNANLFQRLTRVIQPDGGSTAYGYSDTPGNVYVLTKTALDATRFLQSYQHADGLGRPWRSVRSEGATSINVDTQYDQMGRVWKVSNPYRSGETVVWTTTAYDALSRVASVTTPDGAAVGTVYGGSTTGTLGSTVTVTDQALKKRKSVTDALGRLREVYEDPTGLNYLTSYSYDVLDNLTAVSQSTQGRVFVYDSLRRLTSATNPESGTITYQYDNNGNLTRKTDARGIFIDYVYDGLNRNTLVNYSDTAANPDITRIYDTGTNGKGRLRESYRGGNETIGANVEHLRVQAYDAVGRPVDQRQRFKTTNVWSPEYKTSRLYNLAGGVTSQTYPSGRTVDYSYDDAGRTLNFTGTLGDGVFRTYALGIAYSAFGGKQQEQFGTQTPLYHKLHYNVRGQLYDVRLSTMSLQANEWDWNRGCLALYFGYAHQQSGPLNNGNVSMLQHWVPGNDQYTFYNYTEQRYVYDQLNRLASVSEYPGTQGGLGANSFTQIFNYDRWGNRTINPATTNAPEPQFTVNSANNRLGVPGGYAGRMDYDAAGNLVNDTYTSYGNVNGIPTRLYDADNRLTIAKDGNLVEVSSYSYNADGQRVRRKVSGVETWQVYGMDGELLAEYASGAATFVPTKEYGYRNGELLVTVTSGDNQRMKRFLQALYYGALQADAPSQWMTDRSNELAAAGATSEAQLLVKAKEIARALFVQTTYETNPYRSDTQYVTDLYYAYLQRGPDTGGLGWWVPQAAGSVQNRINVLNAFEASGEFQTLVNTLYGSATSDGQRTESFVTNFYQGALSRPPDSNELATNSATLNNAAALGQSQVISAAETMGRNLFAPQVNDAGLSNTQYVTNLYEGFLQRGPDAGGLGWWSGQATVGQGRQNVLNAFATSGAFIELAGTLYREAFWLVTDHLGTPRMVVNKSGSLASVKRHDYLPFGEELFADTGGRTTGQGYTGDSVRQKFTSKERDIETNLDYFLARYYSSTQGRFTSVDPFNIALDTQMAAELNPVRAKALFNAYLSQPQQWNRYAYAINNPLMYVDPTGEAIQLSNNKEERQRQMQALKEAVGPAAGEYLYVNEGTNADGSANYYVGIREGGPGGNGPTFEQINEVAGEFGAVIRDTQVVKLEFVGRGSVTDDSGDSRYIGPGASGSAATPAVTGIFKGQLTIKMLDWSNQNLGYLPRVKMSDEKDNMLTPSVMQGHEIGHARARMTGYRDRRGNAAANKASINLENKIRRLQFPNGPTRRIH